MKQFFREEDLRKMDYELRILNARYSRLMTIIHLTSNSFQKSKSKEFMMQGVARRFGTIKRCVENIFSDFPLNRKSLLNKNQLWDISINLHAFFTNLSGLMDNLAWVIVHEKGLTHLESKPLEIGLFKEEILKNITPEFKKYLKSPQLSKWYKQYFLEYRHPLSHRIPLYIPPYFITKNGKKMICPYFSGSIWDEKLVAIHAQVIADFKLAEEIIQKFCDMFKPTEAN